MPSQLKWFIDPLKIIREYPSFKINPAKSSLQSLRLGMVWAFLNKGSTLANAHDSLTNVRAQSNVLFHLHLQTFIDCKKFVVPITNVFGKNQLNELMKERKSKLPVQEP